MRVRHFVFEIALRKRIGQRQLLPENGWKRELFLNLIGIEFDFNRVLRLVYNTAKAIFAMLNQFADDVYDSPRFHAGLRMKNSVDAKDTYDR